MSMSHVNPNSPQTRAWVQHARMTEGRIMACEFGAKEEKKPRKPRVATKASIKKGKHKNVCDILSIYKTGVPKVREKIQGISYSTQTTYHGLLCDIGFLKKVGTKNKRAVYERIMNRFPTIDEVAL